MPSATDELRQEMIDAFGDIDLTGPEAFLKHRGYILTPRWTWIPPRDSEHKATKLEEYCINFLFDEWDYGGTEPNAPNTPTLPHGPRS